MIIKSVNLLVFVSLPLSIWLGLSGQVSWPTLVFRNRIDDTGRTAPDAMGHHGQDKGLGADHGG
jgi:hypothetical protein